jgi:alpha-L-fucosidase
MRFSHLRYILILSFGLLAFPPAPARAADSNPAAPDSQWFRDAKFGIFMHWGLYSVLGNEWQGKSYYGSGEWLMNRAKIPAAEYARTAAEFNPTNFNAQDWARFVKDTGARYLVITAKHHEGFAMFGSRASPYNIVDATPYHQDPMLALANACRAQGLKFGFYYSQFLDWHEPDGGGNTWDFPKDGKDYKRYYANKSIPQIKELLSNYGPLGLVWFDMPGGLNRDETLAFMSEVRQLQPQCLISSRVGNGLGDFRDLGDSELSACVIDGAWEALFTHNDSWGFVKSDSDFKTPGEILHLLASTSARGGNLILNVGPDGTGRIPEMSLRYLREVGRWLAANGDSIYGTTHSPIPDQPWGVATLKPGKLYLHLFEAPKDGAVFVPNFTAQAKKVFLLDHGSKLKFTQAGDDLRIQLKGPLSDPRDTVVVVEFSGTLRDAWKDTPTIVSRQFNAFTADAACAETSGQTALNSLVSSRYFGNWKHDTCAQKMASPADRVEYTFRFLEPGDYRVSLDYACPPASKDREGIVQIGGQTLAFQSLLTLGATNSTHDPLLFIHHNIGIVTIKQAGILPVSIYPKDSGPELFWLRRLVIEPVPLGF